MLPDNFDATNRQASRSRNPSRAPSRAASNRNHQSRDMDDLAKSELSYVDVARDIANQDGLEDIASDEQDGLRSEFHNDNGVPVHTAVRHKDV